jgi:hypothetical protein
MATSDVRTTQSESPTDQALDLRLDWSRWARLESSFSLLLVPPQPGIFALAEEVASAGTGRRMLALFHVAAADDLAYALNRLFTAAGALRDRLASGSCFVRFAIVADNTLREAARAAFERWIAASCESASGIAQTFPASTDAPATTATPAKAHRSTVSLPSPLPAGF